MYLLGRLDDIGSNGMILIEDISEISAIHGIETGIISASVRNLIHIIEAAKAGAHIEIVSPSVLEGLIKHTLTDIGIERFLKDWEEANKQYKKGQY